MQYVARKDEILDILGRYGYVTVELLSEALHVSQSSIRRDLTAMESMGLVKRSHGGVSAIESENTLTPYSLRMHENSAKKRIICNKAAELVNNGDVIFIDASSSAYKMIPFLADKKKEINDDDILMLAGADRSTNKGIKLEYLQVTTGVNLRSVASIGLRIAGELFEAAATGNGPVDAAISALKQIIKREMTLREFTIQAISKGSDDVGKVHMQVEYNGVNYYGFGANTDIISASVEAYIDCINKFRD